MRRFRSQPLTLVPVLAIGLFTPSASDAALPRVEKARIEVLANRTSHAPGTEAQLLVRLEIEDGWHTNSNRPTYEYLIPTAVAVTVPTGWSPARLEYPEGTLKTFGFALDPISVYDGEVVILARLDIPTTAPTGSTLPVQATVTYQACDHEQCLPPVDKPVEVPLSLGAEGEATHTALFARGVVAGSGGGTATTGSAAGSPGQARSSSLAWSLLLGVLGGLLLNAMPCVLPVLSLKVFGLVQSASTGRRAVTLGALATAGGIFASFWLLAASAAIAKGAGAAVGWGIQFQNPLFVAFLLVVVLLFCLNLWGLFEIPLPRFLSSSAGGPSSGLAGHFSTGLFATLMATPCSAPFLGTALGFALGQSTATIFATFTAIAVGFSLPYLLLAISPDLARALPRPGAWMDTLRGVMGFLLAATAIWLTYVLSAQVGPVRLAAVELALLGLALAVWLRHRSRDGGAWRPVLGLSALGLAALPLALVWGPIAPPAVGAETAAPSELIRWQPFDRSHAEALAAEGQLVFVDVTADWCFTCKFNERLVLNTPEVANAFAEHGVVAMKADWTNRNEAIGAYLAEFGRYGIPFYALYRPGGSPHVFSELLTQDAVLSAVSQAAASSRSADKG
jgi:suppressor for copper-sensitivity B